MTAVHALLNLILLLVILGGTLPFGILLLLIDRAQQNTGSLARSLLIVLTGSIVLQAGVGLFLGMLGQLKLGSVVLVELLLFILGILMISRTKHHENDRLNLLSNAVRQLDRTNLFMLYSIGSIGLFLLITLVANPVIDYDSLWFHLPAIARWYQTGSLTLLDPSGQWIFEHPDAAKYPYNWHILSLLCVLPLGTDVLITFPNFLAWIMLGLSVYLLSREFGANQFYSTAATTLLMSIPFLMQAVNGAQPDLALAAIFTVGLYFAYSCYKTRSTIALFLFMASAGLLSGIKIPGIIYAAVMGGFWAVLEITRRFDRSRSINQARFRKTGFVVLGWIALLFLGSYWYIYSSRIQAVSFNSLFSPVVADANLSSLPASSALKTIFQKLNEYQQSTLTAQFNPASLLHWKILIVQLVSRFQLPFIALTSQIILIPYLWLRYRRKCWDQPFIAALMLFVVSTFLYWNTPYSSGTAGESPHTLSPLMGNNMRYGLSGIAMGAVIAAVVATVLQPPRWIVVAIVWLSGILGLTSTTVFYIIKAQAFSGERQIWLSQLLEQSFKQPVQSIGTVSNLLQGSGLYMLLIALIYAVLSVWLLRQRNLAGWIQSRLLKLDEQLSSRALLQSAVILVVLVGLLLGMGNHVKQQAQTKLYRGIYEYLEQTVGTSSKIAYFSSQRTYLLYGRKLQQTVLHQPIALSNPTLWLEGLRHEQVKFVAVGPGFDNQSSEGQFLQDLIKNGGLKTDFGQDPAQELVVFRLQPADGASLLLK